MKSSSSTTSSSGSSSRLGQNSSSKLAAVNGRLAGGGRPKSNHTASQTAVNSGGRRQAVATNSLLHNSVPMQAGTKEQQPLQAGTKERHLPANQQQNVKAKIMAKCQPPNKLIADQKQHVEQMGEEAASAPLDVEEILWSRQIARIEIRAPNCAPQRLRDMLERDTQLRACKRPRPFLTNGTGTSESVPRNGTSEGVHVEQQLLDWFQRDFLLISRRWCQLSAEANAARMARQWEKLGSELLPRHVFEGEAPAGTSRARAQSIGSGSNGPNGIGGGSLCSASSAAMAFASRREQRERTTPGKELELCEAVGEPKLDELRETARRRARGELLANLAMPGQTEEMEGLEMNHSNGGEEQAVQSCWSGQSRLSVHFSKLSLLPPLEPVHLSVALYDLRMRRKLSEHFHLNSTALSTPKCTRRALFTLPEGDEAGNDLVLVFRLEKALQRGGLDAALEPYMARRGQQDEQRERHFGHAEALAQQQQQRHQRNGSSFRQQIGIVALPLARTVANTLAAANSNNENVPRRAGGPPRSFTDSFIQSSLAGEQNNGAVAQQQQQQQAGAGADTLSETSSTDRLSCSGVPTVPMRPTSSWSRLVPGSSKQHSSEDEPMPPSKTAVPMPSPPSDFSLVHALQGRALSLRVSHFLKGEPMAEGELLDWLATWLGPGQQRERQQREKCPLDLRFELQICAMDELAREGWHVHSPECRLLAFGGEAGPRGHAECEEWMELFEEAPSARDLLAFPVSPRLVQPQAFARHLLFIYPLGVNFSARSGSGPNARNICVRAELLDGQQRPVRAFASENDGQGVLASCRQSAIHYHCKQPQFGGLEWKVLVPEPVPEGWHVRFTFLHVSCRAREGGAGTKGGGGEQQQQQTETPIGFSWLPLCPSPDWQLPLGEQQLPISLDPLPPAICFLSPQLPFPNLRWLDSHRPLFQLSLQLVSSIQPQDQHLLAFLHASHMFLHCHEPLEQSTVRNLLKTRPEPMLAFLHVLLHRLLAILCQCREPGLAQCCFDTLNQLAKIGTMLLDGKTDKWGRSRILADFVRLQAVPEANVEAANENDNLEEKEQRINNSCMQDNHSKQDSKQNNKNHNNNVKERTTALKNATTEKSTTTTGPNKPLLLHEQLVHLLLQAQGTARDTACTFCWFPLALAHRSMAQHLARVDGQLLPRKMRFSPQFMADLNELGQLLGEECLERLPRNFAQAKAINWAWAQFLREGISLVSRSFLLDQLRVHCQRLDEQFSAFQRLNNTTLAGQAMALKLAFLSVLYSHEHFLFLSLPFADLPLPYTSKPAQQIKPEEVLRKSVTNLYRPRRDTVPKAVVPAASKSSCQPKAVAQQQSPLFAHLSPEHARRHLPVALLLAQLHALLATSSTAVPACVDLLHRLICAHESDWRLRDVELRQQLALIYSPLLGIVLEWIGAEQAEKCDTRSEADSGLASEEGGSNGTVMTGRSGGTIKGEGGGGGEERKKLLLCLCWLLRSLSPASLLLHLRQMPGPQLGQFVQLLRVLISTFSQRLPIAAHRRNSTDSFVHLNMQICGGPLASEEFQLLPCTASLARRPSVDTNLSEKAEEKPKGKGSANANAVETAGKGAPVIKWRAQQQLQQATGQDAHFDWAISRQLSAESILLVLDQFDLLLQLAPAMPQLLPDLLRFLLHAMAGHHSLGSMEHIFRTQRAFVRKFPEFILNNTSGGRSMEEQLLSSLCLQLLRHMGSGLAEVRAQAALSAFALLRASQKLSKSAFVRLSKTFTMALSSLVSTAAASGITLNDAILRESLESILQLRDGTEGKKEALNWRPQLEELLANLSAILMDTLKLGACGDDFDMAIELMQRIARGYRNNPELRMAWLMAIARKHLEEGTRRNYAEAGQCLLHCSAIVAEQLASTGTVVDEELLPSTVFQAFEELSENVREEWTMQGQRRPSGRALEKVTSEAANGLGPQCTLQAFGEMVEKTAKLFERAQLFELIPTVFKLVLPMHERRHAHAKLIQLHAQIVTSLSRVDAPLIWSPEEEGDEWDWEKEELPPATGASCQSADKRCFGTYFRVCFFGTKFGELDGQEFVYKEPAITKLAEISHRLEQFYVEKFGPGIVDVWKESGEVDPKALNPEKAYLQITFVEPHFERCERRRRQTHLQRNYRLRQFLFSTPFTPSGKAHGPLSEQHKRKTVLTVENSFPYVKTRLRVLKREQWVLSPIEVALEDVLKRSRELAWAMATRPLDAKMLQMVLQGCIGTTVNQGPLEIARVFLANASLDADGMPRDGLQRRLRQAFDQLGRRCANALDANERLMEPGREEYRRELRRNMAEFEQCMTQIGGGVQAVQAKEGEVPSPAELVQALALAGKIGPISSV